MREGEIEGRGKERDREGGRQREREREEGRGGRERYTCILYTYRIILIGLLRLIK